MSALFPANWLASQFLYARLITALVHGVLRKIRRVQFTGASFDIRQFKFSSQLASCIGAVQCLLHGTRNISVDA